MNKTAIKNFAIWARNKLIAEITYKAGLLGITEKEIKSPLPQSTQTVQFFNIGTKEPYSITGVEIEQRKKLAEEIQHKANQIDYQTAYKNVVEEVAYTWFNRLIAVRFMEVNDYLPTHIRILSSERSTKSEPDLVTKPMDADLDYTPYEKDRIMQLKNDNMLDELFRMLFIKQCNALNAILPELFEKTNDFTELLMNVSFTDQDGVVYHLVHDISEDDFNVSKEGQVEIIGWMYQYYNTEPKDETFALLKKNVKITKERIPSATQLFTPDWIVRYMVENSLGRLWIEGHPNNALKSGWKYYLDEAEQEADVQKQLDTIREECRTIKLEDIKVIDPCMGSGHILVYAFDVLMQIYESAGYSQRDAARSILENNLYGLDIDDRAFQLAYFAVMMKGRQYNRRILSSDTVCHVYSIQESNNINRNQLKYFGADLSVMEKDTAILQIEGLLDTFMDAKEYGSILNVDSYDWQLLKRFVANTHIKEQMTFDTVGIQDTKLEICTIIETGIIMAQKYHIVVTNPPYMGISNGNGKLGNYVKQNFPDGKADLYATFIDKCLLMAKASGYVSMITMQTWMFLASFEKLRDKLLKSSICSLVQIGYNSFPELNSKVAQAVAFTLQPRKNMNYLGTFLDLSNKYSQSYDKEMAFHKEKVEGFYLRKTELFRQIEGHPFVYWMSLTMLKLFDKEPIGKYAEARIGLATGNNDYYLRLWHEVNIQQIGFELAREEAHDSGLKWFPYNKGGEFRRWYGNRDYVINWLSDGKELQTRLSPDGKRIWAHNFNLDYIFKPQIAWSYITTSKLAFRVYEKGFVFDSAGTAAFTNQDKYFYILAYLNSVVANRIASYLDPTMHFTPGEFATMPYIDIKDENIEMLARDNMELAKKDWDSFETSWDFLRNPLVNNSSTIEEAYAIWEKITDLRFNKMKANEEELNRRFIEIYGLQKELEPVILDKNVSIRKADINRVVRSLISYGVGCMLGRYSLDCEGIAYAGGLWNPSKYSSYFPDNDNVLPITDEEYFTDDIVGRFVEFVKCAYGIDTLETNLDFIAKTLGNKGNSSREILRDYFINDFFQDHCSNYSVTGSGKRPIYWLFSSGKENGFKALIYMHRYDENTIGNLRIDYLHRMQRIYEREIARMQETIENSKDAREVSVATKRKEKLVKQLKETKEYDEKIAHLALARISIDLDDGVKVNYEKVQTGTDGKKLEVLAKI